jgi:hypothetical protein
MIFRQCACGAVAGACVIAAFHHSSLCGQFDRVGVYCVPVAAEVPHGPHHERPLAPTGPYTSVVTVASSTATLAGGPFKVTSS